jgi:glycosyltransferase involved in cell wall biosynthesis
MHVLITADTVGGVWTYTRELVRGLVRRGVQVTLVSFGEIPEPRQMDWMQGLRGLDFRPTAFRLEWMQDSAADIEVSSDYLLNVIRETRPDVLHLNQFCYGALKLDIPKIVVAHSDVVSWWLAVYGTEPPDSEWSRWYRDTVQSGLDGATTVLAPSRWMLAQIEQIYGARKLCGVIYNGRSGHTFNPHSAKESLILSVGRLWDTAKQTSLLADRNYGWPVVIAGAAEHPDELLRDNAGAIAGNCKLERKPPQTPQQLQSLFARAGIYAATSRYEPFGLAPLEAALSRCALVANDIPSLREIWGETACYFKTNDPQSLYETIGKLRHNPLLRRHHAELVYQRARRRYSADRMVDEYFDLYQTMNPARSLAA